MKRGIKMRHYGVLLKLAAYLILTSGGTAFAQNSTTVEYFKTGKIASATLPFSEAVKVNDTLYISGTIGNIPGTVKLVPGGIKEEARQTMDNIKAILEAHGYTMRDLVKCTVMLADISEWPTFNDLYKTYFVDKYPARSALGANGLALGARVEVDCIAVANRNR
jgi:2-iminobutanoate/2-iminopropanoate deaminase